MTNTGSELEKLYSQRFPEHELARKHAIWKGLCSDFFSRYVRPDDTVVDIGAGYCEFINNIRAATKIAVDLNPGMRRFAASDVRIINESCTAIEQLASGSVDVVFMSNFLEHLPSKQLVLDTFREAHRILRDGGRVIVLQPNIRFLPGEYWDYFDHYTPLTDRSLVEGLQLAGFEPEVVIPRFLPYTTKSRLLQGTAFVKLYLKVPLVWRLLGKQALVVAVKRKASREHREGVGMDEARQQSSSAAEPSPTGNSSRFVRFLLVSGFAAVVNFCARMVFSTWLSYPVAVAWAYVAGIGTAFCLNRSFVFRESSNSLRTQASWFLLVNLAGLAQTLLVSMVLARWLLPQLGVSAHAEEIAHAIGIGVPAITSYYGHKWFSFKGAA